MLPPGSLNAITDVTGVRVGHATLIAGEGALREGEGPVRTGVTAIVPHGGNVFLDKVSAAVCTMNGFGKVAGFEQVRERGTIEAPILLTNTLNVGRVVDAGVAYMLRQNPHIGIENKHGTVNVVVGECNDGFVNDLRGRHVGQAEVWAAIESATDGIVQEGNVGGGTGTQCFQFKGGIGSASRMVHDGRYTVGALVQTNYGMRSEMMILGAPVGQHFIDSHLPEPGPGSIMMVLATDAPMNSRQLGRMARRAAFALGRTGTCGQDGSGDFVIAFSTTSRRAHLTDTLDEAAPRLPESGPMIDPFFLAAVESIEEAILNALVAAETLTGRDGNTLHAIPHDKLRDVLQHYRRIES
ncbi:MAG: S58 family peptidase [Chloroflexi bacterium]|nr:MAG: S58 family peptidase [Chloroflexota bacterium]